MSDAVEGTILAWRHGVAPVYNVSGGKVVDLATACRAIEELTGAPLDTRAADAPPQPHATRADLSLARSHLGYRPRVALREGLREQIAAATAPPRVGSGERVAAVTAGSGERVAAATDADAESSARFAPTA